MSDQELLDVLGEESQTQPVEALPNSELKDLHDILAQNRVEEQLQDVKKEMQDADDLYNAIYRHTLPMMAELAGNNGTPARMNGARPRKLSPTYIGTQVANMIALKNLKLSLLRQRKDLEGARLDRAMRLITQINKEGDGGGEISAEEMLSYLIRNGIRAPKVTNEEGSALPDTSAFEDDLDERIAKEDLGFTSVTLESKEKEQVRIIYYNEEDETTYIGDEDGNFLEELSLPDDAEVEEEGDKYFYAPMGLEVRFL